MAGSEDQETHAAGARDSGAVPEEAMSEEQRKRLVEDARGTAAGAAGDDQQERGDKPM